MKAKSESLSGLGLRNRTVCLIPFMIYILTLFINYQWKFRSNSKVKKSRIMKNIGLNLTPKLKIHQKLITSFYHKGQLYQGEIHPFPFKLEDLSNLIKETVNRRLLTQGRTDM